MLRCASWTPHVTFMVTPSRIVVMNEYTVYCIMITTSKYSNFVVLEKEQAGNIRYSTQHLHEVKCFPTVYDMHIKHLYRHVI